MMRQDRHQADDERHLPVAATVEGELHLVRSRLFYLRHLLIIGAVVGAAVIAQQFVREDHVIDRDWAAVGELGLRAQRELDGVPVPGHLDGLGDEAVKAEGLVVRARQQALIDIVADTFGTLALDDQGVQAVVGPALGENQPPAFRCLRVHIGKMAEICRLLWLAMHGDATARLGRRCHGEEQECQSKQRNRDFQRRAPLAIDASHCSKG